jgi:hypothetical protein
LHKLQSAVSEGKAIVPLSATHLIETRKSLDLARRRRLSEVMAHISRGWTLAPKYLITPRELHIGIARIFEQPPPPPPTVFGRGISFAFGARTTLRDRSGLEIEMPETLAQKVEEYYSSSEVIEEFLVGIDESSNLAAIMAYKQSQNEFIKRDEEFRSRARPYGGAIHKRAYAANLTRAIQTELIELLDLYGKTKQDFLDLGQDRLMAFFEEVPTLDVEIELVLGRNENWDKKIHINDPADISFLSVAIPYCDVVVTERFWRYLAQGSKLEQRYGTTVLADLADLEEHLG